MLQLDYSLVHFVNRFIGCSWRCSWHWKNLLFLFRFFTSLVPNVDEMEEHETVFRDTAVIIELPWLRCCYSWCCSVLPVVFAHSFNKAYDQVEGLLCC
jgi:hypothetical protein